MIPPEDREALEGIAAGTDAERPRFNGPQIAQDLIAETPIARGGGELYVYRDGHFRPGGRDNLRKRIAARLGDDWRRNRSDEITTYAAHTAPQLWENLPANRINVLNGILDLDAGTLEPHAPNFLSPVQIPVTYDPAAQCPKILQFLADTLDSELIEVFLELAGYLATPDNSLQIAVMFLGGGANGKSTALALLTALIGRENVSNVALHRLETDRFATASLYGKLANVFADLDHRALASSSMFKSITGGDRIETERKHRDAFSFTPFARLIFSANEPPPTPDSSDAAFRRWLIVPFERRFDARTADRDLLSKLTTPAELSGLLNEGLARLPSLKRAGAFTQTTAGRAAAEQFRHDSDPVAGFLAECCLLDLSERIPRSALYPAYRRWAIAAGRKPLGKQRFNHRIRETPGIAEGNSNVLLWEGISLDPVAMADLESESEK